MRERLADMTPEQINELADELIKQTKHRGVFVRWAAARTAGELRRSTLQEDA